MTEKHRSKSPLHATQAKKFDATSLHEATAAGPRPLEPSGELISARVCKGRSIHLPNGIKRIIGSRAVEVDGTTVQRDVTAEEVVVAGPGTTVRLPQSEVIRLQALGFLERSDGRYQLPEAAALTGVTDDVRLKHGLGKPTVAQR